MNREQAKVYAKLSREEVKKINDGYAKHYDVLCAYANGAEIEFREPKDDKWFPNVSPSFRNDLDYRAKPNGEEQPAWRWTPGQRETYFFVNSSGEISKTFLASFFDNEDQKHIDFGNCFRTRKEAESARERVRAALKGETISKMETVESLDGHELSDAEKGVIRILRRCKVETMWNCDFVYPEDHSALTVCESGVLLEFESGTKACEFGELADDVIAEAEERREKGEPSW